jgi:UDP-glucuronate decarboxylase
MHLSDGRVVSNFIAHALLGKPLKIYGDGRQTRSFCYVADLVEGFLRLMDTGDAVTGPMNLGNPAELTILDLAEKVISMTGSSSKIEYAQLPEDDPMRRKPDITLAKATLNWRPTTSLDEGLARTLNYFHTVVWPEKRNPFGRKSGESPAYYEESVGNL